MKKVFKLTSESELSDAQRAKIQDTWNRQTKGTDLEGSMLLILQNGMSIDPLSDNAILQEASVVLERRGKHVYARELRKIAGS